MAGVSQKSCKACGKLYPMNAMRCTCGARLIDAPIVIVEVPDIPETPPVAAALSTDRWTCESCHFGQNQTGDDACQVCEQTRNFPAGKRAPGANAIQTAYILRFPFGDVTFESSLAIGRDSDFCKFSERLRAFESVSRRHAHIEVNAESDLSLVDMGSTNGTYVNGSRLEQAARTTIRIGDEISFSRGLTCQVHRGE
jgi:hypothetical protein